MLKSTQEYIFINIKDNEGDIPTIAILQQKQRMEKHMNRNINVYNETDGENFIIYLKK